MTEIDALKYELEQQKKSFNKLHKMYVSLLKQQGELEKENKQLKNRLNELLTDNTKQKKVLNNCMKENKELKQQKPFLKIIDDYFIKYGDDGELFSMHKPSDIRSLMHILNREHGYNELQCEYNDKDMK